MVSTQSQVRYRSETGTVRRLGWVEHNNGSAVDVFFPRLHRSLFKYPYYVQNNCVGVRLKLWFTGLYSTVIFEGREENKHFLRIKTTKSILWHTYSTLT